MLENENARKLSLAKTASYTKTIYRLEIFLRPTPQAAQKQQFAANFESNWETISKWLTYLVQPDYMAGYLSYFHLQRKYGAIRPS